MKIIYKSCTFWFTIASVVIIFFSLISQGSKYMLLIFSNYPLYLILKEIGFTLISPSPAPNHEFFLRQVFLWFQWHLITFVFYGLILDTIRLIIKKYRQKTSV